MKNVQRDRTRKVQDLKNAEFAPRGNFPREVRKRTVLRVLIARGFRHPALGAETQPTVCATKATLASEEPCSAVFHRRFAHFPSILW